MSDEKKSTEETESSGNGVERAEAAAPAAGSEASDPPSPEAEAEASEPVDPLEEAKAEAARLKDQLLRTAADFDNFRKRTRRELVDVERKGREDLLKELLPVFDNLERAVAHAETATDVQSLADGIKMVMRQFSDTLGKVGIERIESKGLAFDPAVHEAIQQVETDEVPPGSIAEEVQPGYRIGDKLIRAALVVVAKAPAESSE